MRFTAVVLLALLATGCATSSDGWWAKKGSVVVVDNYDQKVARDRAYCKSLARGGNSGQMESDSSFAEGYNLAQAFGNDREQNQIYNDCMRGRGWEWVDA